MADVSYDALLSDACEAIEKLSMKTGRDFTYIVGVVAQHLNYPAGVWVEGAVQSKQDTEFYFSNRDLLGFIEEAIEETKTEIENGFKAIGVEYMDRPIAVYKNDVG